METQTHQQVRQICNSLQAAELAVSQAMKALSQIPLRKAGNAERELGYSQEFLQNAIQDLKTLLDGAGNADSH
jgi:hypothetical protein